MIAYSPETEPARAYLLRAYNDIDIYVEDVSAQNAYVRLFNRILGGRARVSSVFPLHGRANVLRQCTADQVPSSRKRLYILDRDQDFLTGERVPKLKYLYQIRVYCSENLFLSEPAAIEIGMEYSINSSWTELAQSLSLRTFFEDAVAKLAPLFVMYAVIKKLGLTIETVEYSVYKLLRDHNDASTLCGTLIRSRIFSLIRQVRSLVSANKYRSARRSVQRRMANSRRDRSCYISGKHYLLPLLHLRLRNVAKCTENVERLKVRLAARCDLNIDSGLRGALIRALK